MLCYSTIIGSMSAEFIEDVNDEDSNEPMSPLEPIHQWEMAPGAEGPVMCATFSKSAMNRENSNWVGTEKSSRSYNMMSPQKSEFGPAVGHQRTEAEYWSMGNVASMDSQASYGGLPLSPRDGWRNGSLTDLLGRPE